MKILIADDEWMIRELIRATLESESGFELMFASDGEEAVEVALSKHPDLVLLDVRMPRLDGYQACQRIRQDSVMRSKTIMMLTALGQDIDRLRGAEAGADEYLVKPFSPSTLLTKVYEVSDA